MTIFLWVLAIACVVYLTAKLYWRAVSRQALRRAEQQVEIEHLERFFRDPENCRGKNIDDIISVVGPWSDHDDWDWGRFIYDWQRPGLRVRVGTRSNSVRTVEFLAPEDTSRFGTVQEVILAGSFIGE